MKCSHLLLIFFALFSSGCSHLFYQPSHQVFADPKKMGFHYEDVRFQSIDGTPLHGWFFPHALKKPSKGTFILFHGNGDNITSFFYGLAWVTRHGYDLFVFDYRGYGTSEGFATQEGVYLDAVSALIYGRKLWLMKKTPKIIVYGQSLGGNVALRALHEMRDKSYIKAVIIESSFISYQGIAREKLADIWFTWPLQWLAYLLVSNEYSPQKFIAEIAPTPLLVIHGDQDEVVPQHHGRDIFALAKEPKWFWDVKGGTHIDAMVLHQGKYQKKLLEFLEGLQ